MAQNPTSTTYRDAGVDIDAGDALVERIKPPSQRTMRPEVLGGIGGFGALVEVAEDATGSRCWSRAPTASAPSSGSRSTTGRHDTIGIDLVAMCVNDILVQGAEPLFFLDYFAMRQARRRRRRRRDRGHRRRLRAGRLRADRRRDGRDAGHVRARRIRPRGLLRGPRREGRASSTARASRAGDAVIGLAASRAALQRLLAGPQACSRRAVRVRRHSSTACRSATRCSSPRAST